MKKYILYLLILIPAKWICAQETPYPSIMAKEGKDGIYIFLYDQVFLKENSRQLKEIRIYRSENKPENYSHLETIKPISEVDDFQKDRNSALLKHLMKMKEQKSEAEAWNYVLNHPDLKDYGFMTFDINFLLASASAYLDKSTAKIPKGTDIFYQVVYIKKDKSTSTSVINLKKGTAPEILRPLKSKVIENDSIIEITWEATSNEQQEAVFGDIYRYEQGKDAFQKISTCLANINNRKVKYSVRDRVLPGKTYSYYLIPLTFTFLPGPASDTIKTFSVNFSQLAQPTGLFSKDTAGGIFLNWKAVEKPELFTGIIIKRSANQNTDLQSIDTLPANATSFLDKNITAGITYQYLIQYLTIRQNALPPAGRCTAIHHTKKALLESPKLISTKQLKNGIQITWEKSTDHAITGYNVFRSDDNDPAFKQYSNLVEDTTFLDTTAVDSKRQYKYAVKTVSFDNDLSELSNVLFCRSGSNNPPPSPTGLRIIAEGNKVNLVWQDLKAENPDIFGYNIYYKAIPNISNVSTFIDPEKLQSLGYHRINSKILEIPSYSVYKDAGIYSIAITAIDNSGNESPMLPIEINLDMNEGPSPPAEIYLQKRNNAIYISWDKCLSEKVSAYVVYKRRSDADKADKLVEINGAITEFTDTAIIQGQLYFYSISSIEGQAIGKPGIEKGIRP